MPELPEVETVKRGLSKQILGKKINSIFRSDKNLRFPYSNNFIEDISNAKIIDIKRRAKFLIINLNNKNSIIIHLGMSGKILFKNSPYIPAKHDHFILEFTDETLLVFNDARRFGCVTSSKTKDVAKHKLFANTGIEPLSDDLTTEFLTENFKNKSQNIKQTLMDASVIAGIGNIYASEILFLTNINPALPAKDVPKNKYKNLIKNIKQVLENAIKSGGSTLRDYVRSDGGLGYFQHHHKVYDRENQPCFVCQTSIKRIVQQGRSTYFCPNCQKL
ncbi:MAG: bifunctional DNA-formamidopyrimidine glycosylase/DNA-(apurinic or apyrimidinic site) lyase [Rickettsiales bacterium]|nr:bifunctional DNA-formamidopyrimidine glycosylase/DNA-(apurinic or apyrimidinic site) lyase [Rickettsiales bacterium]